MKKGDPQRVAFKKIFSAYDKPATGKGNFPFATTKLVRYCEGYVSFVCFRATMIARFFQTAKAFMNKAMAHALLFCQSKR